MRYLTRFRQREVPPDGVAHLYTPIFTAITFALGDVLEATLCTATGQVVPQEFKIFVVRVPSRVHLHELNPHLFVVLRDLFGRQEVFV